jgi:hypothetical protein
MHMAEPSVLKTAPTEGPYFRLFSQTTLAPVLEKSCPETRREQQTAMQRMPRIPGKQIALQLALAPSEI